MLPQDTQYTKLRWILTLAGLILYVVDIWTDTVLAVTYFQEKQYTWTGLTLMFVLTGLLVTQIFSYAWYQDDMNDVLRNPNGRTIMAGMSKSGLVAFHVFGIGIFTRYYHLLKNGFKMVWTKTNSFTEEQRREVHHNLFCLATDLSMLKLFETFLESVPQLLLQLYIVLGHIFSMSFSFLNVAWALVDYRRCLRRSLPHVRDMPCGLATVIYLLYKLCTITSCILSYSLFLILSTYSSVALTVLWLSGTIWTHLLQTNFCSSKGLELLYRAVIGVILTFTFFNVKGQDTKAPMILYYIFHFVINVTAPLLLVVFKSELQTSTLLLVVSSLIVGCSLLGQLNLVLYYLLLHPRGKWREADEVDGLKKENETMKRLRNFLQP